MQEMTSTAVKMPLSRTHTMSGTSNSLVQDGGNILPFPRLPCMHNVEMQGQSKPSSSNCNTNQQQQQNQQMQADKPKTMVTTPDQVMKLYMNKLTPYEHHEIFNYSQIYFIGANANKRPGVIGEF